MSEERPVEATEEELLAGACQEFFVESAGRVVEGGFGGAAAILFTGGGGERKLEEDLGSPVDVVVRGV